MALPVLFPKHAALVTAEKEYDKAVGDVIATVLERVHPIASVTVMEYVPATSPVAAEVLCPLLHEYV